MPVTIGIFINPGVVSAASEKALPRFNRSFEYDGLGDQYVRFLLEEIRPRSERNTIWLRMVTAVPLAGRVPEPFARSRRHGKVPRSSAACSVRSGHTLACAGKQLSDAHSQDRAETNSDLLQDGSNDLNIYGGNWFLANQYMFRPSSLQAMTSSTSGETERTTANTEEPFYPMRCAGSGGTTQPLFALQALPISRSMSLLIPGEGWQMVSEG